MERIRTTRPGPPYGAPPAIGLGRFCPVRLALAVVMLVGAAIAATAIGVAQDKRTSAVPVTNIDAMSWLCVLDAGDSSPGDTLATNALFVSRSVDSGAQIGVGLCHESFLSGIHVLSPAVGPAGLGIGAALDTTPAGADILTSAGLSLAGYVDIPDVALRRAVEEALGKGTDEPISPVDMAGLTSLTARGMGIANLSGLELAVRLRHLDLYRNAVSDVTPLAGLGSLEMLSLAHNRIRDDAFPTLALLTGLEVLSLAGNALDDFSQWSFHLPRLRVLDLASTSLDDDDLSGLVSGLPHELMEGLYLDGNDITDIGPLGVLNRIKWLLLGFNAIDDISPLSGLTDLRALSLEGNGVGDVSALAGLTALETLGLGTNAIEDISVLAGLTELRELSLADNYIANISPLAGLTALSILDLKTNDVSDIAPLSGLTALRSLNLRRNDVRNLSPLAGLTALEVLDLGSNDVDDISALSGLIALEVLSIRNNSVVDLSPLALLQSLRTLYLEANAIADISPLAGNAGLGDGDFVYLTGNPLSGDSIDAHIPELQGRGVTVEFGSLVWDSAGPPDQSYTTGTAIDELTLPTASGGSGAILYDLSPRVPGLSFDPGTRRLSGTPTAAGEYDMTYLAIDDGNGDTVSLTFTISVGAASAGLFSAQRVITTDADGAFSVHAVDLDGDGDADVLAASLLDDTVAWYENLGGGAFSSQRVITTDADVAASVHAADVDGDGDADVLSASRGDDKIAWYENLGGNQFSSQRVITTDADGAFSVHAADLDGDGDADVLSASENDHKIAWYENLGGGAFSSQRVITTNARGAISVHAADVDGDGDADVLSASQNDDKIAWYENLGGNQFSSQRVITTDADRAISVYAVDLDGDGDADVLSASHRDHKIAWYENLGGGSFSSQRVITTTDASGAWSVHAADLDGDGDADVLSASYYDDKIAWYENLSNHGDDHDNGFGAAATFATALPAFLHGTLESGGDRDVFRFFTGSGTLRVRTNGPTDTFGGLLNFDGVQLATDDDSGSESNFYIEADVEAGVHYVAVRSLGGTTGPYTLSIEFVADSQPRFDGDGPEDQSYTPGTAIDDLTLPAASGGNGPLTYSLTPQVPGLTFDPATRRLSGTPTAAGTYAMTYSATDVDGNAVSWTFTISVEAAPDGAFFSAQRVITTDADVALLVYAADLDGDGDPDVLSASRNDDKIAWYENLGDGSFSAQRVITTDADGASSVHAADLDGDGDPDVLSTSSFDTKVAWYENLGGGSFSAQRVIATGVSPGEVHAVDLDGDGDADILPARASTEIEWYENMGDGAFSTRRVIATGPEGAITTSVRAVDLDGDGDADVLWGSNVDDAIRWHENLGGGAFSAERVIIALALDNNAEIMDVHAADLDGDGDADVLSASNDGIVWAQNLSGGTFSAGRVIDTGDVGSVRAVDLDGDGDSDILSGWPFRDEIVWYENLGGGSFSAGRVITTDADYPISVDVADVDSDGDADVLSASRDDDTIAWYENLSNHGDDHGQTAASATLVTALPAFLHGVIESAGDWDVFRIATGVGTLRVSSNGPIDTIGRLGDADFLLLVEDDDSGVGNNFAIEADVSAGVNYVAVTGFDDEVTGPYTLSIEFVASRLRFTADGPPDQSYPVGTAIAALTLPAASGASGSVTYSLSPTVPGLTFDPATRRLSGTPTAAGTYAMTYTATDADGNAVSWTFTISVAATRSGVSFSTQRVITTDAAEAASVHAADLDGDGDADVLSASWIDDKVAWYENLGGGDFSTQRVITTDADSARSVHAADLDGDGDADVVSASALDHKVAWYENLGGGAFSAQRVITTGANLALSVHAADLDGDGDADVLSASSNDDKIAWYENLGGGAFSAQRIITTDADGAASVHAADLDEDGDVDVLSASSNDDKIAWYENLGGGAFSAQRIIATDADSAQSVHAADLDGDGDADVLSVSYRDDKVAWYENLGGGAFSAQRVITTGADGAQSVHAADLDGDGDSDVLSVSFDDNTLAWYENLGGGAFSAQRVITTGADRARSVYAADLDGDGDADVLSAEAVGNRVAWYENLSGHGDDHGDAPASATLSTAFPAFLHGTLESGGDRDVFRVATGNGTLRVYSNGPTDTFAVLTNAAGAELRRDDDSGAGGNFRIAAEVAAGVHYVDVRGFSSTTTGPYTLSIEFVASRLQFTANGPAAQSYTTGTAITALTLPTASGGSGSVTYSLTPAVPGLSFDPTTRELSGAPTTSGEYNMTYTATDSQGNSVSWTFTISVAAAPRDVSFSAQHVVSTDADGAISVYAADLDGDGDPDLLSASRIDDKIAWYENLGNGAFSAQRVITTNANNAESVHAADLDGDGDPDVLSASLDDDKIAWYENLGNGAFSAQRIITTNADGAYAVHAADIDGDGDADVLAASFFGETITWHENLGGGAFSAQHTVSTTAPDNPYTVLGADLDGDGDADVLIGTERGEVSWHENLGGGAFSAKKVISTDVYRALSVHAADLDGDGDPDVLSASSGDDKLAWYENQDGSTFSTQNVITSAADGARSVHTVDLDGDGDMDVLLASSDGFTWYENQGGGAFSAQRIVATSAASVHGTDLDGDGDPDLLAALYSDDTVAWYENLSDHGDDHGDAPATATLTTVLPAFLHGTLESGGDRDVFRVATGNGTLRVYSNGPTDTYGSLVAANGGFLAQNDDSGSGANFRIETAVAAGVHYVEVRGISSTTTGPYTLTIEFVAD